MEDPDRPGADAGSLTDGYGAEPYPVAAGGWVRTDGAPAEGKPAVAIFDYGSPKKVAALAHYFYIPGCRDHRWGDWLSGPWAYREVKIYVSNDKADWKEVGHLTDLPPACPQVLKVAKPESARYLKLEVIALAPGAGMLRSYEIETYVNFILGSGSFTSRITTKVRSNEGLSYNQGSRFAYRWGYPGTFAGYVQTKSSTVGYAISLILDEFNRIRREPVSDAEMEVAVNSFLESFSNFFDSPQTTMSSFANMEMTGKPFNYYQTYRDKIRAVTKAKVQEVANAYIHPDKAVILIVGDFEPCNKGGDKWPGPLDKLGKMHRISLRDPMTGEERK